MDKPDFFVFLEKKFFVLLHIYGQLRCVNMDSLSRMTIFYWSKKFVFDFDSSILIENRSVMKQKKNNTIKIARKLTMGK